MNAVIERAREIDDAAAGVEAQLREVFAKAGRTAADEEKILDLRVRLGNLREEARLHAQAHGLGQGPVTRPADHAVYGGTATATGGIGEAWTRHALGLGTSAEHRRELRAVYQDLDPSGGYLAPPRAFVDQVITAIAAATPIMGLARVFDVQGSGSLGAPVVENDGSDPTWTRELSIGAEDTAMRLGGRELTLHPLAKSIKVSKTLLRRAPAAQAIVIDAIARRMAEAMERAFMVGNGAGQPLGLFVDSSQGIPSGRDVTGQLTIDDLLDVQHKVAGQYRPRCVWVMSDDAARAARKLKTGDGQYLWQPTTAAGAPDLLLGNPVIVTAYAPSGLTSGTRPVLFGDLSYYWIAREAGVGIEVLQERYAEENAIGLIARAEVDAAPVLAAAFARLVIA